MLMVMATHHSGTIAGISAFWVLMILTFIFADGIFAVLGPYSAEVWPTSLRATGMGSAYGFGGIGKVIGTWGLAVIVGSSNPVTPAASIQKLVPSFGYLAAWYVLAALVYLFIGAETKGRDLEEIDRQLLASDLCSRNFPRKCHGDRSEAEDRGTRRCHSSLLASVV
jgi:putative MFS transporter